MPKEPDVSAWIEGLKAAGKVLVYLLTLAAAWGSLNTQVEGIESRLDRHESRMQVRFNRIEDRLNEELAGG